MNRAGRWAGRVVTVVVVTAATVSTTTTVSLVHASPASAPVVAPSSADGAARASGAAVVRTREGRLRGTVHAAYRSFEGVRYAAPARRWVHATNPRSWSGVRSAREVGAECVQEAVFWRPGTPASTDEDCLFLNVYTPLGVRGKLPVQVFFHGGGGINGAATDVRPVRMARRGNVVVTVNYRLGVLGGLYLPQLDAESPDGRSGGNYANTDKVQALRWVRRNIGAFGGDRSQVAIAGQSAGGGAVCWLLASPSAHGLFSSAAVESAGSCGSASDRPTAQARGEQFARAAGCDDPATMVRCLRGRSAARLLDVQAETGIGAGAVSGGGDLPLAPQEAFASGRFNRVPVVFGNTRNESRAFVYEENDLVRQPVTPTSFRAQVRAEYGDDADRLLKAYPLSAYRSPGLALAAIGTDDRVCGALPSVVAMARWTRTFAFEFRDETAPLRPYMTVPSSFPIGSGHTSEVPYLWQSETATPLDARQRRLSRLMIAQWTRFAATGRPRAGSLPAWPRFRADGQRRLLLLPGGRTRVLGAGASSRSTTAASGRPWSDEDGPRRGPQPTAGRAASPARRSAPAREAASP